MKHFFEFLEKNREKILSLDSGAMQFIIRRSCEIKAEVVSRDERGRGTEGDPELRPHHWPCTRDRNRIHHASPRRSSCHGDVW